MGFKSTLPFWAVFPLLFCGLANAQVTTGSFYGTVVDSSGGAVPAAAITLTHNDTGAAVSGLSDAAGEFGFEFLRLGSYTLRIEKSGFKRFEGKNFALTAGQVVREKFTLEVGAVRKMKWRLLARK